MTDRIELKGIRALGTIGVLAEEQERAQPFEVDITVESNLSTPGQTDSLQDTVNYAEVTETIVSIITNEKHLLLERVAERIAEETLKIDPVSYTHLTLPTTPYV